MNKVFSKIIILILTLILILISSCNSESTVTPNNPVVPNSENGETSDISVNSDANQSIDIKEVKRDFIITEYKPYNNFEICFSQDYSISENTIIYKFQFFDGEIKYGLMDLEFNVLTDLISDYPCRFNNGLVKIKDGPEEYILDNQFRIIEYSKGKPILYDGIWHKEIYSPDEFIIEERAVQFYKFDNMTYRTDLKEYLIPYMTLNNPETGEAFPTPKWGFTTFHNAYISSGGIQFVIPPVFDDAGEFSDGLAAVQKDGKYGYIDQEGELVIDYRFYLAEKFSDGIAEVGESTMTDNGSGQIKRALIDKSGNLLTELKFNSIGEFYEGYAIASTGRNSKVILSNKGTEMFSADVRYISNFQNGYATVVAGPHSAYIVDYWGQRVNDDDYMQILGFREGWCAVATEDGWSFIDRDGEYLSDERYLFAGNFSNGVALVTEMRDGGSYLMDLAGNKYLQEMNLRNISRFTDDGYALAYSEESTDENLQRKFFIIRMIVTSD